MTQSLRSRGPAILVILLAVLLLGAANDPFRYQRPVESKPGFCVLELPPEVLAAAAPDLRDVRLYAAGAQEDGQELAYAIEDHVVTAIVRQSLMNVEVVPGKETLALVDRGDSPGAVASLTVEIAGTESLLKPVILEAAEDRNHFREIARRSIFRTDLTSSLRLRFAPNDRRYLRLRFDDRLSVPVTPTAVLLDRAPSAESPTQQYPVRVGTRVANDDATDGYAVDLGSANLPAKSIVFDVKNQVFSRQVRLFEPILFRDELSLRLVGEGRIERLANGSETLAVPVSELRSTRLEVEVERAGSPLEFSGAQVVVEPKRLVFVAPAAGAVQLLYGSVTARQPHYDLEAVLNHGLPKGLATARLGPATDRGVGSPLPTIERGPPVQPSGFRSQRTVALPKDGSIAYLDLPGHTPEMAHRVRLLAADGRQVPFVVEAKPRRTKVPLQLVTENLAQKTTAKVSGLAPNELLVGLELTASAPALFQREVQVFETERDKRGPLGRRLLGSAHWERRPEYPVARVSLDLSPPRTSELSVELDNGENSPISLTAASGIVARARLDFVFSPGESLTLLSDNPDAAAAKYDLALLSAKLFASPALPATLLPLATTPEARRSRMGTVGFWVAFVVAAGFLMAVLTRLLRSEPRKHG